MKYDFNEIINRKKTGSVKWDLVEQLFGAPDIIPVWIADMDFRSPKPVIDALKKRAEHGIYGYNVCLDSYYDAIINWYKKRHSWNIKKEWICFSPGIVPGINMIIQAFTQPGDSIILQKPVYYPFMRSVKNNSRNIVNNPLLLKEGIYSIDFDDLEIKARDKSTCMIILCNPHNPVGRVWTRDELKRVSEICIQNNVLIVSDEIHCDLVYTGNRHIPFASLSEESGMNSITCTSPSKTFNLAGLHTSNLIIPDPEKRKIYLTKLASNGIMGPTIFGSTALEAAYNSGEEWLEQLMKYLESNLNFLTEFIEKKLPGVGVIRPQATTLVWLDFRKLGLDSDSLKKLMLNKAGVAMDEGYIFGRDEGSGFERINIACPGKILKQALEKIAEACRPYI